MVAKVLLLKRSRGAAANMLLLASLGLPPKTQPASDFSVSLNVCLPTASLLEHAGGAPLAPLVLAPRGRAP